MLSESQKKLQAKFNAIAEFGTTPSDEYAYHHRLFRAPIAAAVSRDAKNREWLDPGKHDWLSNDSNRVVVELSATAGLATSAARPGEALGAHAGGAWGAAST